MSRTATATATALPTATTADTMRPNIVDLIVQDHNRVRKLFEEYMSAPDTVGDRTTLLNAIFKEISLHGALEEDFLYPVLLNIPATAVYVMDSIRDHRQVKEDIIRLHNLIEGGTLPSRDQILKLRTELEKHLDLEEREVLPKLREAMPKERLVEAGALMFQGRQQRSSFGIKQLLVSPTTTAAQFGMMPTIPVR